MEDRKEFYLQYFKEKEMRDTYPNQLAPMEWDDILWHIYAAVTEEKLFSVLELANLYPNLLGYLIEKD